MHNRQENHNRPPVFKSSLWVNFLTSGFGEDLQSFRMRRVKFLNMFAFVTVIALLLFGAYNTMLSPYEYAVRNGLVEIGFAICGALILAYLRLSHNVEVAINLTLLETTLFMTFLLITGGINGTGIFWWFCLPAGAFYLKGSRKACWWVLCTFAIFTAAMIISAQGYVELPYTVVTIRQFLAAYLVVCLLMASYERIREDYEHLVEQQKNELIEVNKRLHQEILERRKTESDLESARIEAENANRAKSDFLSRMSHELRTPMNSILGFSQLLSTDEENPLLPEQHESVEEILTAGKHLLTLIDEVLDLARIESGRMHVQIHPFPLSPIIDETVSTIRPLADLRSINIQNEISDIPELHVMADRGRLKQVILNLLSNAVKYNRDSGQIRLLAKKTSDMRVEIRVADTGYGIPEEKIDLLFKPFQRLEPDRGAIEGTGIGLTIVKQIMELMNGSVEVDSTPNLGSCFILNLPYAGEYDEPVHSADPVVQSRPIQPTEKQTVCVLYIEDDPANVALVKHILDRRPGIQFLHAAQGHLGTELVKAHEPDIVLLDIRLPDMSGIDVLKTMRSDPATRETPVIIVTASAMPHEREQVQDSEISAYLTKPLDVPLFLETIDSILRNITSNNDNDFAEQ